MRLAALLTIMSPPASLAWAATADEKIAKVQSAFLLNFIRYTEWPADRYPDAEAPIELIVVGPDELGPILEATVADKTIRDRTIRVRRRAWPRRDRLSAEQHAARVEALLAELADAEMVYLGEAMTGEASRIAERLKGEGVLIVGRGRAAAAAGAALSLAVEDDRMVFYANRRAIAGEPYRISSRLLQLARLIEKEEQR